MADDSMFDEDKALFRDQMRSVKPLHEKTKRISSPKIPTNFSPQKPTPQVSSSPPLKEYFLSDYVSESVLSDTILSYAHPSLSNKRFRDLRNGQIPWDAKLDLHGFKTDPAREALTHFIQQQMSNNSRCLLIVHGKGGHLGAPPVIKNMINRWLPQFAEVLAFHSALAKDGGRGAVYVMLKKQKMGE